jgi:hypothetical protein
VQTLKQEKYDKHVKLENRQSCPENLQHDILLKLLGGLLEVHHGVHGMIQCRKHRRQSHSARTVFVAAAKRAKEESGRISTVRPKRRRDLG